MKCVVTDMSWLRAGLFLLKNTWKKDKIRYTKIKSGKQVSVMKYLEPISETSYLSAVNARHYRKIMRIFFLENEKMHVWLRKEEVLEKLHEEEGYEDYPMEQLKLDLDALVNWKNLTTLQDSRRVYTIADYKNKQFQYSMSEYAVEIERMTVRLENLFIEGGSLSTNLFQRLADSLEEVSRLNGYSSKELNEWWRNLQEDFRRLNQNSKDYLREFYAGKSEKLLKSIEFIVHKDRVISYLREFIQQLQHYSIRISNLLEDKADIVESKILEKVVQSELEIPRALSEASEIREDMVRSSVYGKWRSLKGWFLPIDGHEPETEQMLEKTNDIIRSIIQNASLIVQTQNWGISRKDDYKKFLHMFSKCETLEDAHKLSAHVFGVQQISHFKVNSARSTDRITCSVYEEDAIEYQLKPHTRVYRERKDRQGFRDKSLEKLMQKNEYLRNIEDERLMLMKYIHNGVLNVADIDCVVPEKVREVLLRWIAQANLSNQKKGRTEYGQEFYLRRHDGSCVLKCEDGDLIMPSYVLEFMK